MKKIKKFLAEVVNLSLAVVPMVLLAWGLSLATGAIWDALMLAGMVLVLTIALKKYRAVRAQKECLDQARGIVMITGVGTSFVLLALQLMFCLKNGVNPVPCEAAITWLFLVGTCTGIAHVRKEQVDFHADALSMCFGFGFTGICALIGIIDLVEYFIDMEVPARVADLIGVMAPVCALGCIVCLVVGAVQKGLS